MLLTLALLHQAQAQAVGGVAPALNAQYFRPSVDATRTFWTDESMVPAQRFAPKLLLHYTNRPLLYQTEDGEQVALVSGVAQADVMLSATVDRFRLGVDVPVYLNAEGVAGTEFGLGDLSVDGKVMVLPEKDAPVGLAVSGRVFLPTATVSNALGAPNVGWELAAIVDKRFLDDRALLAANVALRGGPNTALENVTINDYVAWRAGGAYDISSWVAGSAELVGSYTFSGEGNEAALPVEAMFGAHFVTDDVALRIGGGPGLTQGIGAPDWRVVLGVDFVAKKPDPDTDGDGLTDAVDPCPAEPEDVDGVLDDDGCPDAPTPVTLRVVDGKGVAIPGATVSLSRGEAAAEQGPAGTVFALEPGYIVATVVAEGFRPGEASFAVAPVEPEKVITVELAPVGGVVKLVAVNVAGEPVDVEFFVAGASVGTGSAYEGEQLVGEAVVVARAQGYKVAKTDVVIVADEMVEAKLVMEPSKADLVGDRIDIRDSVYFDTGKATIQARSFALLDEVVAILMDHGELTKLRIEGHTDSRGSATSNKTLSQKRADAVRTYLIDKGVEADRLVAEGFGEEKPVDAREVSEAWEKNRRVDFFVMERADGAPTDAP